MKIGIYMPAYQAEQHIAQTLRRIPDHLKHQIHQILILDDGSTDQTSTQALSTITQLPQIELVRFEHNQGYGAMVREAWVRMSKNLDLWICLHADGQYAPEEMPKLIDAIQTGGDLVQGSRLKKTGALQGGMPIYKWIGGHFLCLLERWILQIPLTDFHSGYLAFSSKAFHHLNPSQLDGDFDIDLQLIVQAKQNKLKIQDVSISTRYADEVSYLNPIQYLFRIIRILIQNKKSI